MKKIILLFTVLFFASAESQNAIQFNGTNGYITFGNNSNLGLSQFSIECWFKRTGSGTTTSTGTGGVTGVPLVTKGRGEADGSTLDMNYFLGIRQSDSTLVADFEEGSGGGSPGLNHPIIGITKLSRNVWYHVAVTYDNSTWKLYLNGQLESQVTINQPVQNLSIQHSAIGSAQTSNGTAQGFFHGTIDEVRIWNNARNFSQIISTINSVITSTASGLVARWGLDEGSGTTVGSTAGTTINGTIVGSNWSWVTTPAPFNINIAPNTPTLVSPVNLSTCNNTSSKLTVSVSDPEGDSLWIKFYGRKKNNSNDFSIIPLPDTQFYTSEINGATNVSYKSQMNWVTAKRDSLNIKFISGLGDCVENGDNGGNDVEWKRADTAMRIVETNTTIIFPDGIPYGLNVGNHDQSPAGNPNGTTTYFNQYFGVNRFSGRNYWGGNYGSNADNNYQLFTAEGIDFIVINLEYDQAADPAVLIWAAGLLQTYPTRKAIVSSHWLLNLNGTFGAQGQATYNALKGYPNFFLMLCGHVSGEAKRTEVFNGNTVHCLLSDYQSRANGGDGWIRIVKFRPSLGKINVYTYSPKLNQSETDADSQFILDYDFGLPYTLIDSVKVASGQNAFINWNNTLGGTDYEWYATASDNNTASKSQTYNFKTNAYQTRLPLDTILCGGNLIVTPLNVPTLSVSMLWMNGSNSASISVNTSTMVTLQVTDSLSCISRDTMNVIVTTTPGQPGVINGNVNPCIGSVQNYSISSVNGATSYSWALQSSWSGTSQSNSLSATAGTASGAITIFAMNACGISPSRSLNITVNTIPPSPATISGTNTICLGTAQSVYSITPVTGASSYSWTLPVAWSGSSTTNIVTANPFSVGGLLTVAASNSCGLSSTQSLSITMHPLPVVTIVSSSSAICLGDALLLTASGANTYTWNTSNTSATISPNPTSTTNYTVSGIDNNGCSNLAASTVTVHALPIISISGNTTICLGDILQLLASGANTYTWNGTVNNVALTLSPTTSAAYTVVGKDVNGCEAISTVNTIVNPLPVVLINGNNNVCLGASLNLTASGAVSYTWASIAISNSISVTPLVNTSYTVIATDINGCQNSALKNISINPLPTITLSGNMLLCFGETATIAASGASTYSWSNGIISPNLILNPIIGSNYSVIGTDLNSCKNSALTSFTVNPSPTIIATSNQTLICAGESATLSVSGASNYLWNTSASTSSIVVSPLQSTHYSVTGTNPNNCSASTNIEQKVNECTSIGKLMLESNLLIYPNPNIGSFNIELKMEGIFTVEIFNSLGQHIHSSDLQKGNNGISLNGNQGIYFYVILNENKAFETGKIVIE
ncbi:LamG-like jellyroll fold domain-containing protein [Aurantibacillus circumpalustris]|uniref:LamG-like jellyroll fold domain-containing protein n=1 Tax=Aurantibacillus circumpalustris TaxID=3036359 RepID=UPI00295AC121|nr:LamG-like jellyroll fold domain-containing protein [Aurantibacillus circumpalustris]